LNVTVIIVLIVAVATLRRRPFQPEHAARMGAV
jgi:hypothetical protein